MNTPFPPYTMLVTGASGALGSVLVSEALAAGWNVVAWDRGTVDVTNDAMVERAVAQFHGPIHACVHCVGGIIAGNPIEVSSAEDFMTMYVMNTLSAYIVARHLLPHMYKQGYGSFLAIASQSVVHPVPNRAAYSASKAALASLMSSIAEEGRPFNVRANTLVPSIIRTPANLEWASAGQAEDWISPEQLARTALLVSDPSNAMSGALIPVFGNIPF
jgi:NAD(P)-dependent dehydrogenase (short-subunit alcohol dehydrogenase family)